jgi:hypothetical protein
MSTRPSAFTIDLALTGLAGTSPTAVNGVDQYMQGVSVIVAMGPPPTDRSKWDYLQFSVFRDHLGAAYDMGNQLRAVAKYIRFVAGSPVVEWGANILHPDPYESAEPGPEAPGFQVYDRVVASLYFSGTSQQVMVHGLVANSTTSLAGIAEDSRRMYDVVVQGAGIGALDYIKIDGNSFRPSAPSKFWTSFSRSFETVSVADGESIVDSYNFL